MVSHILFSIAVCGGEVVGSNFGSINSPGYPGLYPHNRDCFWRITVDAGLKIMFAFGTLRLETHDTCDYDYLEVNAFLIIGSAAPHMAISAISRFIKFAPQSKNTVRILDHMQRSFFCLGKFLKKLADDQCSSTTKGSICYIKHSCMYIEYNLLACKWIDQKFDV